MSRGFPIAVLAGAFLVGFATIPTMLPGTMATSSLAFAQGERTFVLPHVFDTKRTNKPDGYVKRKAGKDKGRPAGLAVSDPGAEGTKPTKKSSK
jgi:hypothetical protein